MAVMLLCLTIQANINSMQANTDLMPEKYQLPGSKDQFFESRA
jgi:hypothetical protein